MELVKIRVCISKKAYKKIIEEKERLKKLKNKYKRRYKNKTIDFAKATDSLLGIK